MPSESERPDAAPTPDGAGSPENVVDATKALKEGKPKPKKRTGTMGRTKDGAARPRGDGKTARGKVDVKEIVEKYEIHWLNAKGGGYFMRDPALQEWMTLSEGNLERWLMGFGLEKGDAREPIRGVERVLLYAQTFKKLDVVMNIAGHRPGVETGRDGLRVLVPRGPNLVAPKEGEWPTLRNMIEGVMRLPLEHGTMPPHFKVAVGKNVEGRSREVWNLLAGEEKVGSAGASPHRFYYDQTALFYSWLADALRLYWRRLNGENPMRNAPGLILAGPRDSYKTFLQQWVVVPLLGGRTAKPESMLTGRTDFNADLFGSEVLTMGDSPLSTESKDRKLLGEWFKNLIGEQWHRFHPKGRDAVGTSNPIWRFCWSINANKDALMQLPPMVDEILDKMLLLQLNPWEPGQVDGGGLMVDSKEARRGADSGPSTLNSQLSTNTAADATYEAFGERIAAELPAFAHFLLHEWKTPKCLVGKRYAMIGVQAPELMLELFEDSVEGEVLYLLDAARWDVMGSRVNLWEYVSKRKEPKIGEADEFTWEGGWEDLKALMEGGECSVADDFKGLFKRRRLDMVLARLSKASPDRVEKHRKTSRRLWRVHAPVRAAD